MKKIILHLIATNFFGGPEKQILEHLKRLDPDCFSGQIASYLEYGMPNELIEQAKCTNVKWHAVPMYGPLDFKAQIRLNNLIRKIKPNLLCVHGYKACVMGLIAGKHFGIPVIAFSRGYTSENLKIAFYNWLERLFLGFTDGVVSVSQGQQKHLEAIGVKAKKSWVVHNSVSLDESLLMNNLHRKNEVFQNLKIPSGSNLVVSAGRLSPEKGHRFLIESIARLNGRLKNTYFVFCGDGMCMNTLIEQAKHLNVLDKCRFPGFRRDIKDIFQSMDLMVLPSLTEGLPNVVLEAFAAAKPVVATRVGGVPEVVQDGVYGYLVPFANPSALADAILKCFENPEKMKSMGFAGYEKVKNKFSFDDQNAKLEVIYYQTIGKDY